MSIGSIKLRTKTASECEVLNHLTECGNSFITPLSNRTDLKIYSRKIVENAITFEAWHAHKLVGLIAAYFNDEQKHSGFITNVSVVPDYEGKGIGSQLLLRCLSYSVAEGYREVRLEVDIRQDKAIRLYQKHRFVQVAERDDQIIMHWRQPSSKSSNSTC